MRTLLNKSVTGGVAESGYYPALVEEARIVDVNVRDWTVDAISQYGERRFFEIQAMSPYFHFANGEGIYVMPEIGSTCWVCTPSTGLMAQPFILGWGSPVDERDEADSEAPAVNYRSNRSVLNPGDIMMKTRDENFVILRRGGVVQVGSTPLAQRFYIPLGNLIRDVVENYQMRSLAGDLDFKVHRTVEDVAGNQLTSFSIKSKLHADEPGHTAVLNMGSHQNDSTLRLSLLVNESGAEDAPVAALFQIAQDGSVTWDVEGTWTQVVTGNTTLTVEEGSLLIETLTGNVSINSGGTLAITSAGQCSIIAQDAMTIEATTLDVEADQVNLVGAVSIGGSGGEPLVLGTTLVNLLTEVLQQLASGQAGVSVAPGSPQAFPALSASIAKLQQILSQTNTTT